MGFLRKVLGGHAHRPGTVPVFLLEPEHNDAWLDIVCEGSYQFDLEALFGAKTTDGATVASGLAMLVPEPKNRNDRYAIAVLVSGRLIGYLRREDAILYGPPVHAAAFKGRVIACHARLVGGRNRGPRDIGSIGVQLNIGSPRECMGAINGDPDEDIPLRADHPWPGYLIAFTGDSGYSIGEMPLDRFTSEELARRAGMSVHPRVTKQVQLLVDCDPSGVSGNQRKAIQYGIPVVTEADFWAALGVRVHKE